MLLSKYKVGWKAESFDSIKKMSLNNYRLQLETRKNEEL